MIVYTKHRKEEKMKKALDMFKFWHEDYLRRYEPMRDVPHRYYPIGQKEMLLIFDDRMFTYCFLSQCGRINFKYLSFDPPMVTSNRYMDESEWQVVFASKLARKINKSDTVQERVSDRASLSLVSMNRYCNSLATPSLYNMSRIAKALECSLSEFYVAEYEGPAHDMDILYIRPIEELDDEIRHLNKTYPDELAGVTDWYPVGVREIALTSKHDYWIYDCYDGVLTRVCPRVRVGCLNDLEHFIKTRTPITYYPEDEWRELFADRLLELMDEAGVSKSKLARDIDVTIAIFRRYCTGQATPSFYVATKIARALGVTMTELFIL